MVGATGCGTAACLVTAASAALYSPSERVAAALRLKSSTALPSLDPARLEETLPVITWGCKEPSPAAVKEPDGCGLGGFVGDTTTASAARSVVPIAATPLPRGG